MTQEAHTKDLIKHLDYAVWLKSRGVSYIAIAETFKTSPDVAKAHIKTRAKLKGIALQDAKRGNKKK